MNKKVLSVLLAASVVCSSGAALAQEAQATQGTPDINIVKMEDRSEVMMGALTITEIGDNYIVGTNDEKIEIRLNISDETIMIDSDSQLPFSLSDIKKGDEIYTEYSDVMTQSLPPQSTAYLLVKNYKTGGMVNLINADEVSKDEDGNLVVTDNKRNIIVRASKDSSVKPYRTKNIDKLDDITAGSTLLMWYDIVALSMPAQAGTNKVVVVSLAGEGQIVVDGKVLSDAKAPYYDESTAMVPLRKISEKLGYKVSWNEENESIIVEGNSYVATLVNGDREVKIEKDARSFEKSRKILNAKETVVKDDTTFVPLEFFKEFGNEVSNEGGVLSITSVPAE